MMSVRPRRRLVPTLLALVCAASPALAAEPAVRQAAGQPEVRITGTRGQQETYTVALDALYGLADHQQKPAVQALAKTAVRNVGSVAISGEGRAQVRLGGLASLAELQQAANQLTDARAVQHPEVALIPAGGTVAERQILTRFVGVRLGAGAPPIETLARRHGLTIVRESIPGSWLLEVPGEGLLRALDAAQALAGEAGVKVAPVLRRPIAHQYIPTRDPMYDQPIQPHYNGLFPFYPILPPDNGQWHLHSSPRGMNCEPVWDLYRGRKINVAVLDQGMEYTHPDLGAYPNGNVRYDLAWDFIGKMGSEDAYPLPTGADDNHATCVGGCIAAREGNGVGGVGSAFNAHLIPLKILGDETIDVQASGIAANSATDEQMSRAFTWQMRGMFSSDDIVHVSNNSWGPGGWWTAGFDEIYALPAMESAIANGRANRGVVFCFSSGNSHGFYGSKYPQNHAGYNGNLNRYTIPIGALNRGGRKTSYSSIGACLHVSAPGGDLNFNPYTATPWADDQPKPEFWPGGILTTDRTRAYSEANNIDGLGYFPGEFDRDGDDTDLATGEIRAGSVPDPQEDLDFWGFVGDQKQDLINEANPSQPGYWVPGMDLDGDGWPDTGEDRNLDFILQKTEDLDGDGHFDVWLDIDPNTGWFYVSEDRNDDGMLQPEEDVDGDGHMDWWEDLDYDGNFDDVEEVDANHNGILEASEDLDGDGHRDRGEDWDGDNALDLTEELNGDSNFDEIGEDTNRNGIWDGGDYTEINLIPFGGPYAGSVAPIPQDLVGTSFSCPNTAGVVALMLEANPTLTWRDVQHIMALRGRKPLGARPLWRTHVSPDPVNLPVLPGNVTPLSYTIGINYDAWILNASGMTHSMWYGFGAVQASRYVFGGDGGSPDPNTNTTMAANPGVLAWPMIPVEATPITATFVRNPNSTVIAESGLIPDDSIMPRLEIPFTLEAPADFRIESVELKVDATHPRRGDLTFALVSDAGTVGEEPQRLEDISRDLHHTFTFRTFWNEVVGTTATPGGLVQGNWKLIVIDNRRLNAGQLDRAELVIHGYRPYPTPTVSSHEPSGIAVGTSTKITVRGSGFRRNAANEVTVTGGIWKDQDPMVAAIGSMQGRYITDDEVQITADGSGLELLSPGVADVTVVNPALVIGQTVLPGPQPDFTVASGDPTGEDRYATSDVWESGPERWDVTPTDTGIERRVKRDPLKPVSFQCAYSRPPEITVIPDYILPAGTKAGTLTVSFNVHDPDSDPATINPGKEAEVVNVTSLIYNTAIVDPSTVTVVAAGTNADGSVDYNMTFSYVPNNGGSNIAVMQVLATDTAVTTTSSFRVGVQSEEEAPAPGSSCGGGGGLALVGLPLGLWLIRRRRR